MTPVRNRVSFVCRFEGANKEGGSTASTPATGHDAVMKFFEQCKAKATPKDALTLRDLTPLHQFRYLVDQATAAQIDAWTTEVWSRAGQLEAPAPTKKANTKTEHAAASSVVDTYFLSKKGSDKKKAKA